MQENILPFLKKNNNSCIVIYGPTGSGKTQYSIKIAQLLLNNWYNPFIISSDSRQIYKWLDIGTGKILPHEMEWIPHIGIDIIDPTERFSVVAFQKYVFSHPLYACYREDPTYVPIICWGTGLYIDSIVFERDYMGEKIDSEYREYLEKYRVQYGNQALWNKLFEVDPLYAQELHVNNYRYVIRWLEIYKQTAKSKRESVHILKLLNSTLFLTPYRDSEMYRKQLYENIEKRVNGMFKDGLYEETISLIQKFWVDAPGLETIGYKECVECYQGKISTEEMIARVIQYNRNYAKRQISWNKKYEKYLLE